MDDKANYKNQVRTLAILAMNLALENDYYKRKVGEIAGFRELPETVKKLRELQTPLETMNNSANEKDAAEALQSFLNALQRFHH